MGVCCVPGCSNSLNSDNIIRYSIPKRPESRRKAFLKAINRQNVDGSEWQPTPNSKICNHHFVGGSKSENPSSVNYLPTIGMPQHPLSYWDRKPKKRIRKAGHSGHDNDQVTPREMNKENFQNKIIEQVTIDHSSYDHSSDQASQREMNEETVQSEILEDYELRITYDHDGTITFDWPETGEQVSTEFAEMELRMTNDHDSKSTCDWPKTEEQVSTEHAEMEQVNVDTVARKEYEDLWKMLDKKESTITVLQQKISHLERKILTIDNVKTSDKLVRFYTGFCNYETFLAIFHFLLPKAEKMCYVSGRSEEKPRKFKRRRKLSLEDEFFMTLVRLKVGLMEVDMARNFGISQSYCSKVINTWIDLMYFELKSITVFPSSEKVASKLPEGFKKYPNTRIILDCTEQFIETPSNVNAKKITWSSYKTNNTLKFLIGITPNGYMSFISRAWGGRASDKLITRDSGVCSLLNEGDQVMVDRGFDIQADLHQHGADLVIPAFKGVQEQLSASEVHNSLRIAQSRIHVERFIGRVKEYHLLDREMRLSMHKRAEQIFCVCAYLTNFQTPIIKEN